MTNATWTPGYVAGRWVDIEGKPHAGQKITFRLASNRLINDTVATVDGEGVTVTLDENGQLSGPGVEKVGEWMVLALPAADDHKAQPVDGMVIVTEHMPGGTTYGIGVASFHTKESPLIVSSDIGSLITHSGALVKPVWSQNGTGMPPAAVPGRDLLLDNLTGTLYAITLDAAGVAKLVPISNIKGPPLRVRRVTTKEGKADVNITQSDMNLDFDFTVPPTSPMAEKDVATYAGDKNSAVNQRIKDAALEVKLDPWPQRLAPFGAAITNQDSKAVTMVIAGSSTAAQGVASAGMGWVDRLTARLGPRPLLNLDSDPTVPANGAQVWTAAVGGTTSANYLTDAKVQRIGKINPSLMIHMVGSNDYAGNVSLADYKARLKGWVDKIGSVAPDTIHLFVHQQGRNDVSNRAVPWEQYGVAMKEVADGYGPYGIYLDFDAVMRRTDAVPGPDWISLVAADRTHMNDPGHKFMADHIGRFLGLPDASVLGVEHFDTGNFGDSSDKTALTLIATINIPPRPFPRRLIAQASIFAGVNSGYCDIYIDSDGAVATQALAVSRIAIPRAQSMNHPILGGFSLAAHRSAVIRIAANPYGGNTYISGDPSFMAFTVQAIPA